MLTPLRTKLSDRVYAVYAVRRKVGGLATTLSANSAAAATTMTLTSVVGADSADPLLIGSEEDVELRVQVGAPAAQVVTIGAPGLKRAHVTGEAVYEGVAYDLGNVTGVQDGSTADVFDNETDTALNPDGRRLGHLALQPQADIGGWSPQLFALVTGTDLARVRGAGTSASPEQLHSDGSDFGRVATALVIVEILADGSYLRHAFDACDADYTQLKIAFGQGRETMLAGRFVAANHAESYLAIPAFTVNSTLRASKRLQLESLLEAGLFTPAAGGLSTTTTGAVVLDATVVPFTAVTAVAGGKWYEIAGGGKKQILWVESVNVLNVTMRTHLAYGFPAGSTITEINQTSFSGLKEGTTEFSVGGAMKTPPKFDNSRVQAGARPGSALFSLAVQPTARTLENLRLRLGLPASSIVASTALVHSDLAGTDAPVGWFTRVQREDVRSVYFVGSDCDNGMEQLAMALSKNDLASIALSFRSQLVSQLLWS